MMGQNISFKGVYGKISLNYPFYPFLFKAMAFLGKDVKCGAIMDENSCINLAHFYHFLLVHARMDEN